MLLTPGNRMICKHSVLGIPDMAFRHVASDAIVLRFAACRQVLLAGGEFVTFLAARPIEVHALRRFGLTVRVVAGTAPQALPARSLAGALLQLFEMAVRAPGG